MISYKQMALMYNGSMEEQAATSLLSFFSGYQRLFYKRREMILRAEDTPQGVYFIKEGYVRFYAISKDGEELSLLIFKPYDFFPVRWAITGRPLYYYYESLTPVEVFRSPREGFVTYLKNNPEVLFQITSSMLIRLNTTFERMKYLVYGNAFAKVASMLVICVQQYGEEKGKMIRIGVPLTHQDIASLIGMTRETVSVEMGKLEKKGLISYEEKHIIVTDLKGLETVSMWSAVG